MIKFVKPFTAELVDDNNKRIGTLLWGDPVHVLDDTVNPWKVEARTQVGRLDASALRDTSLLEVYVIDVGQGDALLLKTPDEKWHLVDAGTSNATQMLKKGAANFLRWKFLEDLKQPGVTLATVVLTHPDFDHFGGLFDVLAGDLHDGRTFPITVANFYHSGLARYDGAPGLGRTEKGTVAPFPAGSHGLTRKDSFITELLDGRDSFVPAARPFADAFAKLAALVATVPAQVRRLSLRDGHLPGYGPGAGPVAVKVLGPVLEMFAPNQYGLRSFTSESKTCNGHSLVLRLDYGDARLLLTGDQNRESQRLLLSYLPAKEFAADVVKACHHGAEDVEMDFIRAMAARATVISSGDNEDYSHPRPVLMGASARYGRECVDNTGKPLPPLIYSTELARSTKLAPAAEVSVSLSSGVEKVKAAKTRIRSTEARAPYRELTRTPIATDLIYGLVNIRTDGRHILCATMEEKGNAFDVKVIKAGKSPVP